MGGIDLNSLLTGAVGGLVAVIIEPFVTDTIDRKKDKDRRAQRIIKLLKEI